jgi:hypothetical protein
MVRANATSAAHTCSRVDGAVAAGVAAAEAAAAVETAAEAGIPEVKESVAMTAAI